MVGLQAKGKSALKALCWTCALGPAPYLFDFFERTHSARVDCLEPNFVSLEAMEFPAYSPKSSSNNAHLSDVLQAECEALHHTEDMFDKLSRPAPRR